MIVSNTIENKIIHSVKEHDRVHTLNRTSQYWLRRHGVAELIQVSRVDLQKLYWKIFESCNKISSNGRSSILRTQKTSSIDEEVIGKQFGIRLRLLTAPLAPLISGFISTAFRAHGERWQWDELSLCAKSNRHSNILLVLSLWSLLNPITSTNVRTESYATLKIRLSPPEASRNETTLECNSTLLARDFHPCNDYQIFSVSSHHLWMIQAWKP